MSKRAKPRKGKGGTKGRGGGAGKKGKGSHVPGGTATRPVDTVAVAARRRHLHLLEKVKGGQVVTARELEELREYEDGGPSVPGSYMPGSYVPVRHHGPQPEDPSAGGTLIRLQSEAAKFAGVTVKTIRQWKNKQGMPVAENGWYIKSELDLWARRARGEGPAAIFEAVEKAKLDLITERTAKLRAERGRLEREIRDEYEKQNVRKVIVMKRGLLGMGRKLAPRVVNRDQRQIRAVIDDEVKAIIAGFAGQ